jgi:hypothetical protein
MGDQMRDPIVEKHKDLPAEQPAEAAPAPVVSGEEEASDSIFGEFLLFLKEEKKWWLAPLVVVLLALSAIIMFAEGSAIAPFIYTIF